MNPYSKDFAEIAHCGGQATFAVRCDQDGGINEAQDIVQETYVRAFTALDTFRGDAAFSTWLTRIALNEANGRLRPKRRSPVRQKPQQLGSGHET